MHPKGGNLALPPPLQPASLLHLPTEGKAGGGQSSPDLWGVLGAAVSTPPCLDVQMVVFPKTDTLSHIKKLIVNTGTY